MGDPDYFLCPAGVVLRDEVDAMFPNRDKTSDGWIGDASHQARKSEHNPCWTCAGRNRGIVLAIDIDIDDGDPGRDMRRLLINELIGDPRVWYIISNGIIYSRTHGWAARKYTGSNGHFHHLHVSFMIETCWDTSPFFGPVKPQRTKPRFLDVSKTTEEFLRVVQGHAPRYSIDVLRVQRLINARTGARLKVDGYAGPNTLNAWGALEGNDHVGRPRVPDGITLRRHNHGMFRIVA